MSERPPDFDELVGVALEADERARLRRVHELLVEAGPPPELVAAPARIVEVRPLRRRGALIAIAASLVLTAFALGVAIDDSSGQRRAVDFVAEMEGPSGASAELTVFEVDEAGNWPMEIEVAGLAPAESGRPFELWLTRDGELSALCGSFLTDGGGWAVVPVNAPYRFEGDYGWVVVEEGSRTPLLST